MADPSSTPTNILGDHACCQCGEVCDCCQPGECEMCSRCAKAIDRSPSVPSRLVSTPTPVRCYHEFRDTVFCVKCGWTPMAQAVQATPEQVTSTPAGSDPWADVPKCQCEGVAVYVAKDVDRARAAVKAQHAHEIATLTADYQHAILKAEHRERRAWLEVEAHRHRAETADADLAALRAQTPR